MSAPEIDAADVSGSAAGVDADLARTVRRWLGLVVFLIVVFLSPAVLLRAWQDSEFDQAALNRLDQQRPEIALLGNSMLETRIDPEYLSQLLNGRQVASLAVPGSQSAVWYLQLKNLLAASEQPPATVFVFFRNDLITQPLAPLDDRNRKLVESLKTADESGYEAVLDSRRSLHQKTVYGFERIYPIQLQNSGALKAISDASAFPVPSSREELSARADDLFAFHNRRDADEDEPAPEYPGEFADDVESSFLPLMLKVAEEAGISLAFVRVQARPNRDGTLRESESMAGYSQELADYLDQNGAGYIDFSGNPSVDRALYYDSFHIRQRYLQNYTELFLREAQGFIKPVGPERSAGQGG